MTDSEVHERAREIALRSGSGAIRPEHWRRAEIELKETPSEPVAPISGQTDIFGGEA